MTNKIEKALSLGKIQGAKKLLEEYYLNVDKQAWLEERRLEYVSLFKTVEVTVDEELDDNGEVVKESYVYFDYVDGFPIFSKWLDEETVTQEYVEATYNENGEVITENIPEVREKVRPYVAKDVTQRVEEFIANDKTYKDKLKEDALNSLVVAVNSVEYDAHRDAIDNMTSVVSIAGAEFNRLQAQGISSAEAYTTIYKTVIEWKGADNKPHSVQIESVVEALKKAMLERATKIYGVQI